jgi:hypothetical protein
MQQKSSPSSCVEFVYRVYDDGSHERFATVLVRSSDGELVRGPTRPTGQLGRFAARAVADWRRVVIDQRGEPHRGHSRRR